MVKTGDCRLGEISDVVGFQKMKESTAWASKRATMGRERAKVREGTELRLSMGRTLTGTRSGMETGPEPGAKFLSEFSVYVWGGVTWRPRNMTIKMSELSIEE